MYQLADRVVVLRQQSAVFNCTKRRFQKIDDDDDDVKQNGTLIPSSCYVKDTEHVVIGTCTPADILY
jgi:hypothetical protein